MKKLLFIFIFILVFCSLATAQWESIGPYGGALRVLAIAPSNDNIVYTFSNTNLLFKSTKNNIVCFLDKPPEIE